MTSGEPRGKRQNRKATLIVTTLIASLTAGAAVASGEDGGVTAPSPPAVKDLRCVERCLDVRKVTETGLAEISGKDLDDVKGVRLSSDDGKLQVKPRKAKRRLVRFKVPKGARSGKPVVIDRFGNKVRSPVRLAVKPKNAIEEVEGFEVTKSEATPSKSFFDGKRRSTVEYLFEAEEPTDIRVDVLKGKRKRLIDSIVKRDQEPFASHSVHWKGLTEDGKVAPNGKYKFQVSQISGGDSSRSKFRHYDHKFPLRARHSYGDGLGAGRGHQGQDVFARCGKPLYAARGGRVEVKASHSAAGNYIVIDGRKTGRDYVYMHMEKRGRPKEGSKIRTGERIGFVSDTGRATGCHLHFELWSAPGWYQGGKPINPTKRLKRWDRWS